MKRFSFIKHLIIIRQFQVSCIVCRMVLLLNGCGKNNPFKKDEPEGKRLDENTKRLFIPYKGNKKLVMYLVEKNKYDTFFVTNLFRGSDELSNAEVHFVYIKTLSDELKIEIAAVSNKRDFIDIVSISRGISVYANELIELVDSTKKVTSISVGISDTTYYYNTFTFREGYTYNNVLRAYGTIYDGYLSFSKDFGIVEMKAIYLDDNTGRYKQGTYILHKIIN